MKRAAPRKLPANRCARSRCARSPVRLSGEPRGLCLAHAAKAGQSRYGVKKVRGELRSFDSRGEARRDAELVLIQRAGAIRNLQRQVTFDLYVSGVLVTRYRADWTYTDTDTGKMVVEDFKGVVTDLYLIKKRLMDACHGIAIYESHAPKKGRK